MLPYAPVQERLEDAAAIELDVDEGLDGLRRVQRRKKLREFLICPAVYKGSPMTPLVHPTTRRRSYHIIKLVSSKKRGVEVELIFCDQNMYLLAYRRFIPGKGWSPWYHFKGQGNERPHFIQPEDYREMTGITVTHKETITIPVGEYAALEKMFHALANPDSSVEDVEEALFCGVIVFCEVTRLESVNQDIIERLSDYWADPSIAGTLWTLMKSWQKLSDCALDNRIRVRERKLVRVDPTLMELVRDCGINHIDEVIGPEGELKLILLDTRVFTPYINVAYPADFRDHFPELEQDDAIRADLVEDVVDGGEVEEG